MISDAERTRLKKLFSDTISLLCRSGLPGASAHRVDALIGVTLDNREVVLVNFSENFLLENDCSTRMEIGGEKNSDTQSNQMPEKSSVKDEHEAGVSDYPCSSSAQRDGAVVTAPPLSSDSHDAGEQADVPQGAKFADRHGSTTNSPVPESSEAISSLESDGDCILIKTELQYDNTELNSIPAISFTAEGNAEPSAPVVPRTLYNSSSQRVKRQYNMQRHARRNAFGSKFSRPQQRYKAVEQTAANMCQVTNCC